MRNQVTITYKYSSPLSKEVKNPRQSVLFLVQVLDLKLDLAQEHFYLDLLMAREKKVLGLAQEHYYVALLLMRNRHKIPSRDHR